VQAMVDRSRRGATERIEDEARGNQPRQEHDETVTMGDEKRQSRAMAATMVA
jgi:hypothetical protein